MAAQAGWYPDPAGTPGCLRFWNGAQWTDDLMSDAPQPATWQSTGAQQQAQAVLQGQMQQAEMGQQVQP